MNLLLNAFRRPACALHLNTQSTMTTRTLVLMARSIPPIATNRPLLLQSIRWSPPLKATHIGQDRSPLMTFLSDRTRQTTHLSRTYRSQPPPPRYSPPQRPRLEFEDGLPRHPVFWGILILNGLVYLTWQRAYYEWRQNRDISLHKWMSENFTVNWNNFKQGRYWTLITACFSHEGTGHIFMNTFTFWFMAPAVLSLLGTGGFLTLYLGGGLVSSLTSLWFNNTFKPQRQGSYASHGASGAIYSVISFFACVAPTARFAIFGIIPMPAWAFVSGIFCIDSYSALNDKQAGTDTAGHIGGILGGIGYFLLKRFRVF